MHLDRYTCTQTDTHATRTDTCAAQMDTCDLMSDKYITLKITCGNCQLPINSMGKRLHSSFFSAPPPDVAATEAKYEITFFVFSVLMARYFEYSNFM